MIARKNVAVVLAGGSGSRLGGELPKQFLVFAGRSVLEHAVSAFEGNETVDEIVIVSHPDFLGRVEELKQCCGWKKVAHIVPGGRERYDSSLSAMALYRDSTGINLIFHDAARPLVSQRIISDVTENLRQYSAVGVGIPSSDTLWETENGTIRNIPDRHTLWRAQTPQAFHIEVIRQAYEKALKDPDFRVTDDCGVVKKYLPETKIHIVQGEERNMKLTYKEELKILELLL